MVVGHGGEAVAQALAAPDLTFVTQDPPRGTGDAVRIALAALPGDGVTLVVNGDCPLIPAATLAAVADVAAAGRLALLTARVSGPAGLGRIVRDAAGAVRAIVEERDATPAQRAIDEIYTGVLAAPTALLRAWVAALRDDNAQREFYLTDIVAMAVAAGVPVVAHLAAREEDVQRRQRPRAARRDRAHRPARGRRTRCSPPAPGSPIPSASTCAARSPAAATCASTSAACSKATCALGDDVSIGAYCVLRERDRRRRHDHRAVLASRGGDDRRQLPHRPVRAAAARRRRSPTTCTSATSSR